MVSIGKRNMENDGNFVRTLQLTSMAFAERRLDDSLRKSSSMVVSLNLFNWAVRSSMTPTRLVCVNSGTRFLYP